MSIERLRALEKDIRNSGGPGCQYHADQLASLIAELGQEVGAVSFAEWFRDACSATDFDANNGDAAAATNRSYARQAWCAAMTSSPAHTSEARDAAAKFVERVESVASFLVGYGEAAEVAASGLRGALFDYDAAMRQEAGK